jgi:hypothetical protein
MPHIAGGTDPIVEARLVYQVGIANVFIIRQSGDIRRVQQGDYRSCEWMARGIRLAGVPLTTWHCDMAGDILPFKDRWQPGQGELWKEMKGILL